MSAPIMHVVLTEKIWDKCFANKDKEAFLVGTSFPDIRRLAGVDRSVTHFDDVDFGSLIGFDSFTAGFMFHSWVDQATHKYRMESAIFELFPESKFIHEGVKIFEDNYLYDKVNDWDRMIRSFESVREEELRYGASKEVVAKWHGKLRQYFSRKPDSVEVIDSLIKEPIEVAEEIMRVAKGVKDEAKAIKIIEEYYQGFGEELF
ncbi:MAG TPA: hypothetical protein PLI45_00045 [Candidatus Woesebacteria bacterium]|nr:hypothetical protein [Candidatus Woesebacteria bacterium]